MGDHRQHSGIATHEDLHRFSPGDECPECGCTLGSDGAWYIDADQAPTEYPTHPPAGPRWLGPTLAPCFPPTLTTLAAMP